MQVLSALSGGASVSIGLIVCCCVQPAFAQDRGLKSSLEKAFVGRTAVSKIVIGNTAVPNGASRDIQVNTLVYPDGQIKYRVEGGFVHIDVDRRQMLQSFESGTSFQIVKVDLKDDRFELRLESARNEPARLKLMLGPGWQSKIDVASVQAELARVLVFAGGAQPEQRPQTTAESVVAPPSDTTVSTSAYRRPPNAPVIPGRISPEELNSILAATDVQRRLALSDLLQQAAPLSEALQSLRSHVSPYPNFASHPLIRELARLQEELGKSLRPRQLRDVEEMSNLLERSSFTFYNLVPSDSSALVASTRSAILAEQQREGDIDHQREFIVAIEGALDSGNLRVADEQCKRLSSDAFAAGFAPTRRYLELTQDLRADLSSCVRASDVARPSEVPASQQLQKVASESDLLIASNNGPITAHFLQEAIKRDAAVLNRQLAALPTFRIDETPYRLPPHFAEAATPDANEKLRLLSGRIAQLDERLAAVSEVRSVLIQHDALRKVASLLGDGVAAALDADAKQLAVAERIRTSLTQPQAEIKARVAEEEAREWAIDKSCYQLADELVNTVLRATLVERAKERAAAIWSAEDWAQYRLAMGSITTSVSQVRNGPCAHRDQFWREARRVAAGLVGRPESGVGGYLSTGSAESDAGIRRSLLSRMEGIQKQITGNPAGGHAQ